MFSIRICCNPQIVAELVNATSKNSDVTIKLVDDGLQVYGLVQSNVFEYVQEFSVNYQRKVPGTNRMLLSIDGHDLPRASAHQLVREPTPSSGEHPINYNNSAEPARPPTSILSGGSLQEYCKIMIPSKILYNCLAEFSSIRMTNGFILADDNECTVVENNQGEAERVQMEMQRIIIKYLPASINPCPTLYYNTVEINNDTSISIEPLTKPTDTTNEDKSECSSKEISDDIRSEGGGEGRKRKQKNKKKGQNHPEKKKATKRKESKEAGQSPQAPKHRRRDHNSKEKKSMLPAQPLPTAPVSTIKVNGVTLVGETPEARDHRLRNQVCDVGYDVPEDLSPIRNIPQETPSMRVNPSPVGSGDKKNKGRASHPANVNPEQATKVEPPITAKPISSNPNSQARPLTIDRSSEKSVMIHRASSETRIPKPTTADNKEEQKQLAKKLRPNPLLQGAPKK